MKNKIHIPYFFKKQNIIGKLLILFFICCMVYSMVYFVFHGFEEFPRYVDSGRIINKITEDVIEHDTYTSVGKNYYFIIDFKINGVQNIGVDITTYNSYKNFENISFYFDITPPWYIYFILILGLIMWIFFLMGLLYLFSLL